MASGVFPVIFTQSAFRSLLYHTVINAVKADFVLRERSAFKDKLDKQVASELVTVYDDGLMVEKQIYSSRGKLSKKKVYEYEYHQ